MTYWLLNGDYLDMHEQADAFGISKATDHNREFYISDGNGLIVHTKAGSIITSRHAIHDARWDNHMLMLNA